MYRTVMVAAVIGCMMMCVPEAAASYGSDFNTQARHDEGHSQNIGFLICARNEKHAQQKKAVFTPEKVREDLAGYSVGPVADVKIKTGAAFGDSSGASTGISSAHVYVPIPMGVAFDQTNITDLEVRETRISGSTATLVVHVETVAGYAGKLRLRYESVAGEWVLRELENLSFKAQ